MLNIGVYTMYTIHVLKITLGYLLIAEIIEMTKPAPMVNLPRSPLYIYIYIVIFVIYILIYI